MPTRAGLGRCVKPLAAGRCRDRHWLDRGREGGRLSARRRQASLALATAATAPTGILRETGIRASGSRSAPTRRPRRSRQPLIASRSSSVASTSGRRRPPTSWPISASAALIAIGFVVTRSRSIAGRSSSSSARAPSRSPARKRRTSSATCGPTTCVCTQIPPRPPSSRNGRIRSSSPAYRSSPDSTIRRACSRSAFACLTAVTFGISAPAARSSPARCCGRRGRGCCRRRSASRSRRRSPRNARRSRAAAAGCSTA